MASEKVGVGALEGAGAGAGWTCLKDRCSGAQTTTLAELLATPCVCACGSRYTLLSLYSAPLDKVSGL